MIGTVEVRRPNAYWNSFGQERVHVLIFPWIHWLSYLLTTLKDFWKRFLAARFLMSISRKLVSFGVLHHWDCQFMISSTYGIGAGGAILIQAWDLLAQSDDNYGT